MPGNRPNSTSGRPMPHAFLGDDRVAGQREFHAAAERIALHQRDGAHVAAEAAVEVVHAVDAATRVGEQVLAVVVADQASEQFEVAAEVERGGVRGEHDMAQLAGMALALRRSVMLLQEAPHVVHQFRAEAGTDAGAGVGVHVAASGRAPSGSASTRRVG